MRLLRVPRPGFPYTAPTLPRGVEPVEEEPNTGLDYDTAWARREPARYARGAIVEYVMRPVVQALASPTVAGLDRLEGLEAPAIFAANHHSHLDTPLLLTALPARFRHRVSVAAAADYFFDNRVKGTFSALAMSAVPIDRTRVSRRSADLLAEVIEDGWSLVIFPEGGRSPDGWGQEFRGGAAYLSLRTDRPVVPIHLEGTGRILRKGSKKITPSRVHVTFGSPMRADEGEDARRFGTRIERVVAALADEQATDFWMARKRAHAGVTPALTGPTAVGAWRRAWALDSGRRRRSSSRRWP